MTPEGKLDKPKILDYIEMVMRPDEVKAPLKEGVSKCMEEHGTKSTFYSIIFQAEFVNVSFSVFYE